MINKNFGKIENNKFSYAPNPLVEPSETQLGLWTNDVTLYLEHGYLPIEAVAGMKYYYNKYYIENNILYRCIREDVVDGVVLQYTPSQLIDIYFEVVN